MPGWATPWASSELPSVRPWSDSTRPIAAISCQGRWQLGVGGVDDGLGALVGGERGGRDAGGRGGRDGLLGVAGDAGRDAAGGGDAGRGLDRLGREAGAVGELGVGAARRRARCRRRSWRCSRSRRRRARPAARAPWPCGRVRSALSTCCSSPSAPAPSDPACSLSTACDGRQTTEPLTGYGTSVGAGVQPFTRVTTIPAGHDGETRSRCRPVAARDPRRRGLAHPGAAREALDWGWLGRSGTMAR